MSYNNDQKSAHKKPAYGENLFFIQLPAFLFLVICVSIGVFSIKSTPHKADPFPEPTLTAEEAKTMLAAPVSKGGVDPNAPSDPIAAEGMALIGKSDCMACHKLHEKLVGPAYADVAATYKNDPDAITKLVHKVKAGGSGVWGSMPMTPHPSISDEDLGKMVKAVLSVTGGKALETVGAPAPTTPAPAAGGGSDEGMAIISKNDCVACHKEKEKLVGPAYIEIAEKYKGQADIVPTLVHKVKTGGMGVWGNTMPMTPHPNLDDALIEKMVRSILALAGNSAPATPAAPAATGGSSDEGMAIISKNDCVACHKEKEKLVGPAYIEIAEKYKGQADIVPTLVHKVKTGGMGVWGNTMPMTPHPNLDDALIEKMVRSILALAGNSAPATTTPAPTTPAPETKPTAASADTAAASEGMKLISQNDCVACHKEKDKLVGPSYLEIAEKYKGQPNIVPTLVHKVKTGGMGVWGNTMPMTPHPNLDDKTIETMVKAILSLAK